VQESMTVEIGEVKITVGIGEVKITVALGYQFL
jgi:hypothetical protein